MKKKIVKAVEEFEKEIKILLSRKVQLSEKDKC